MAKGSNVAVLQQRQVEAAASFSGELDKYAYRFRDALPAHIPVERFKRVIATAVVNNPDLLAADRRSLFNSCIRAATDGLYPDGREGALVIFNTDVTVRDPDTRTDHKVRMQLVQWMPMIHGIRKRVRNSGEVDSFIAEAVHKNDKFRYNLGDNPYIEHEPPPLGEDRGEVIGAYSIIRLKNGEIVRDVMDKARIERARAQSRAKDSLMWTHFYDEAAKKTVARRCAKQAPFSPELERLLQRDEEDPGEVIDGDEPPVIAHQPEPPRPPEQKRAADKTPPKSEPVTPPGPLFAVVDLDGVEHLYEAALGATAFLLSVIAEAEKQGGARLDGIWESNDAMVEMLRANGHAQQADSLAMAYADARQRINEAAAAKAAAENKPETKETQRPPETSAAAPVEPAAKETAATSTVGSPGPSSTGETSSAATPAERDAAAAAAATSTAPSPETASAPANDAETRQSFLIPMVLRQGKPDWRTWTMALFLPRLRRQRDPADLAFLLGDNEENLAGARQQGALTKDDATELARSIEHQWSLVK